MIRLSAQIRKIAESSGGYCSSDSYTTVGFPFVVATTQHGTGHSDLRSFWLHEILATWDSRNENMHPCPSDHPTMSLFVIIELYFGAWKFATVGYPLSRLCVLAHDDLLLWAICVWLRELQKTACIASGSEWTDGLNTIRPETTWEIPPCSNSILDGWILHSLKSLF